MLALEDLKGLSDDEIKNHIAQNYSGTESGFDYGCPSSAEISAKRIELDSYDILIAYESVGSWGCDSSSWFLLRHKETDALKSIHGSHCSCYGFEGQGDIEDCDIEYLKSNRFYLPVGGYDEIGKQNEERVRDYIYTKL